MAKVSVIVPVYNSAKFLKDCLDSILKQSLTDIEIICIDDGSSDGSTDILKQYALKDRRIKVLQQHNKGAGAARNLGMSIATGEYCSFLDSDDFFESSLLEDCYNNAITNNADIVIYKFNKYDDRNGNYIACDYAFHKEYYPDRVFSAQDYPVRIFNSFNPTAWNKFFSMKFLQKYNFRFQNNMRTNDLYFTMSALSRAARISLLDKVLVYYRVGIENNSQSTNCAAPLDFHNALVELKDYLKENSLFNIYEQSYRYLVVSTYIYNISNNDYFYSV